MTITQTNTSKRSPADFKNVQEHAYKYGGKMCAIILNQVNKYMDFFFYYLIK